MSVNFIQPSVLDTASFSNTGTNVADAIKIRVDTGSVVKNAINAALAAVGLSFTNPTIINPVYQTQTLTDAATTNWNMDLGQDAKWIVPASVNRTLAAPTNIKVGGQYILKLGLNTPSTTVITWPSIIAWPYNIAPDLTTSNWTVFTFVWSVDHGKLLGSFTPGY